MSQAETIEEQESREVLNFGLFKQSNILKLSHQQGKELYVNSGKQKTPDHLQKHSASSRMLGFYPELDGKPL
jgi:hypothetical protein